MEDVLEALRQYGADIDSALARFMGNTKLYSQCLGFFIEDDTPARLSEAIAAEDYKKAFEYAHTLKGTSGNMGFDPLYKVTCKLVEPLRIHDYSNVFELYEPVRAECEKIIDLLKKYFA